MLLSDIESQIQIVNWISLVQLAVIQQIWTMTMNKSAEGETILPRVVEVLHIHVVVWSSLTLTPEKKTVTSREF